MKSIKIFWVDSRMIVGGWQQQSEFKSLEPTKVESIGFIIEDNKNYITICHSFDGDCYAGVLTIPKCCITKKKILK